jgi:hypothetical protein
MYAQFIRPVKYSVCYLSCILFSYVYHLYYLPRTAWCSAHSDSSSLPSKGRGRANVKIHRETYSETSSSYEMTLLWLADQHVINLFPLKTALISEPGPRKLYTNLIFSDSLPLQPLYIGNRWRLCDKRLVDGVGGALGRISNCFGVNNVGLCRISGHEIAIPRHWPFDIDI